MFIKTVARANRKIIRWAVRNRLGSAYLFAIFWVPMLTIAGITWAIFSIHEKSDDIWPFIGIVLLAVKKVMALMTYVLSQAERTFKAMRHYRRHFRTDASLKPRADEIIPQAHLQTLSAADATPASEKAREKEPV
jgi:hypothetical protein